MAGDLLVAFGGTGLDGRLKTSIYSLKNDTWLDKELPEPEGAKFPAVVPFGNTFLTIGGGYLHGSLRSNVIYEFDATALTWVKRVEETVHPTVVPTVFPFHC